MWLLLRDLPSFIRPLPSYVVIQCPNKLSCKTWLTNCRGVDLKSQLRALRLWRTRWIAPKQTISSSISWLEFWRHVAWIKPSTSACLQLTWQISAIMVLQWRNTRILLHLFVVMLMFLCIDSWLQVLTSTVCQMTWLISSKWRNNAIRWTVKTASLGWPALPLLHSIPICTSRIWQETEHKTASNQPWLCELLKVASTLWFKSTV